MSLVLLFQAVNIGGFQFPVEPALVGTFQINRNHNSGVIHLQFAPHQTPTVTIWHLFLKSPPPSRVTLFHSSLRLRPPDKGLFILSLLHLGVSLYLWPPVFREEGLLDSKSNSASPHHPALPLSSINLFYHHALSHLFNFSLTSATSPLLKGSHSGLFIFSVSLQLSGILYRDL